MPLLIDRFCTCIACPRGLLQYHTGRLLTTTTCIFDRDMLGKQKAGDCQSCGTGVGTLPGRQHHLTPGLNEATLSSTLMRLPTSPYRRRSCSCLRPTKRKQSMPFKMSCTRNKLRSMLLQNSMLNPTSVDLRLYHGYEGCRPYYNLKAK